jgi:hypothetical protein
MPPITITEKDFTVLAMAASDAQKAGETEQAKALDKLARMANAALTAQSRGVKLAGFLRGTRHSIRWQDMPSTIDP